MDGSAGNCWAERLAFGAFRRAGRWVGLVGHAEWPARRRSEDRPLHGGRIQRSSEAGECEAMVPVVGVEEVASGEWRVTSDNSRAFGRADVAVEVGVIRSANPSR